MNIKIYQVDAFTNQLFGGNPAAVCPLEEWLDDSILQNIAFENNLADTAFYVKTENKYAIRWFTPTTEVALCGHATLATAHVLFEDETYKGNEIQFTSKSGDLIVKREDGWLEMDFPIDNIVERQITDEIKASFNNTDIIEVYKGKTDYMVVFENEEIVQNIEPNIEAIKQLDCRGIIATAKSIKVDFVSRFFGPNAGIIEDPVTGSAHTTLVPYWANILGKEEMVAKQLSKRGGFLKCCLSFDRVLISGQAQTFMVGTINIQ